MEKSFWALSHQIHQRQTRMTGKNKNDPGMPLEQFPRSAWLGLAYSSNAQVDLVSRTNLNMKAV